MRARRCGGFTLIELVAVICIVAITSAVLLERLLYYQERAERAKMEQIAVLTRTALQMKVAAFISAGRFSEIKTLADENPMDWFADKPVNYLGQLFDPQARSLPKGSWYFDAKTHYLVYVLNRSRYFVPGRDDENRIRFQIQIETSSETQGPGGELLPMGEITKMGVYPVTPYSWFPEEEGDWARQLLK